MAFSKPVADLIRQRKSCRTYMKRMLEPEKVDRINGFIQGMHPGPCGSTVRFLLAASAEGDERALKGLGTYGVIRNPAGFLIGAVHKGNRTLVDFGYHMEHAALFLQDMGLGTCWLGGSFRKSRFAEKIACTPDEVVPAVLSVGYPADRRGLVDSLFRKAAGSDKRKPWSELFFTDSSLARLGEETAGAYATSLEMVRLGPSASNRQPWRTVYDSGNGDFYFYLARTPGYAEGSRRGGIADLQQVDMGIAACHFELTAKEIGLSGQWTIQDPNLPHTPSDTEYIPPAAEYIMTWTSRNK